MARPSRIEFPGALYHVISRGKEHCPVVRDDEDWAKRMDWLRPGSVGTSKPTGGACTGQRQ